MTEFKISDNKIYFIREGDFRVNNVINSNYAAELIDHDQLTITKRVLAFETYPVAATGLTYDPAEKALLAQPGSAKDGFGVVNYAVKTDGSEPAKSDYSTKKPTGSDAGTYTVYACVFPDSNPENYVPSEVYKQTVTIGKAKAEFSFTGIADQNVILKNIGSPRQARDIYLFKDDKTFIFNGVTVSGWLEYKGIGETESERKTISNGNKDELKSLLTGRYAGEYSYEITATPAANYEFPDGTPDTITGTVTITGVPIKISDFKKVFVIINFFNKLSNFSRRTV